MFELFVAGYMAVLGWQLVLALRAGPGWRSGHQGDRIQFTRGWVIIVCILNLALGTILLWLFR